MVNALAPAAMAAGNVEMSQRVTDVVLGALAQAAPDLIPAASSGTMNNLSFGGWDASRKSPFAYYETIAGGMGASSVGDGHSATHTHMTNTLEHAGGSVRASVSGARRGLSRPSRLGRARRCIEAVTESCASCGF